MRTTRAHPVSRQCDQGSESLALAHAPTRQLSQAILLLARDDNGIVMRLRKLLLHPPP